MVWLSQVFAESRAVSPDAALRAFYQQPFGAMPPGLLLESFARFLDAYARTIT